MIYAHSFLPSFPPSCPPFPLLDPTSFPIRLPAPRHEPGLRLWRDDTLVLFFCSCFSIICGIRKLYETFEKWSLTFYYRRLGLNCTKTVHFRLSPDVLPGIGASPRNAPSPAGLCGNQKITDQTKEMSPNPSHLPIFQSFVLGLVSLFTLEPCISFWFVPFPKIQSFFLSLQKRNAHSFLRFR